MDAEQALSTLLDELFADGWHLPFTGVTGSDLRLKRVWDAAKSQLLDTIDLRRDGAARVDRRFVDDEGGEQRWYRDGSLADVVQASRMLPAPEGHTLQPSSPALGSHTARVVALFYLRPGWVCVDGDPDGLHFEYRLGAGGDELERPRLEQFVELGIESLAATVTPNLDVRVSPWQVNHGCSAHASGVTVSVGFHDSTIRDVLGAYELESRNVDLPALAYCLLFGACSMRDLSIHEPEYVEGEEGGGCIAEAFALLDPDEWVIRLAPGHAPVAGRHWPDGTTDLLLITSSHRAYGLRTDADSWVRWKRVGDVRLTVEAISDLASPGEWGAPTEGLFPASPEDQALLAAVGRG